MDIPGEFIQRFIFQWQFFQQQFFFQQRLGDREYLRRWRQFSNVQLWLLKDGSTFYQQL